MKKNQEIRPLIIKTTKQLIRKNPRITIKDIAEACYVNIAAVNYYFGSKEALINIVMEETVDELKTTVQAAIESLAPDASLEATLEKMVTIVYNFAMENLGIVSHMFLHDDMQLSASNIVIETFFKHSAFTENILGHIAETTGITDKEVLYARYMLLFSSFSIPIFIQLMQEKLSSDQSVISLQDLSFRKTYVKELLRIIK